MRIAVASGKGGTGKTTVATNLAVTASRTGRSVGYLDCDVEEPNRALFLKPPGGRGLFPRRDGLRRDPRYRAVYGDLLTELEKRVTAHAR